MRIQIVLSSIVASFFVFVTGCAEKPETSGIDTGETENPENNELTAEEQKEKLMDVATQFIGVFNTADQKEAVAAFDWIVYQYMDYSWDDVEEYYEGVLNIVNIAARNARLLSEGHFNANAGLEIYDFPKFTGIFEANDRTMAWEYVGESDNVVLRCKDKDGNPAEMVLAASGEEMEFEYGYWDYTDGNEEWHPFTAVVPANITLSVKVNGNEYIAFDFNFDAEKSSHVKVNTEVRITNIVFNLSVSVEKTSVSSEVTVRYGDNTLLSAVAAAPSCVLMDKGENMDWDEWFEHYCDAFEYGDPEIEFGKLMAEANVLSQVQIRAESNDPADIYHSIMKLDDEYYGEYGEWFYNTREYNLALSDLVNDNMNISLYYSSDVKQAEIITDVMADSYDNSYYDLIPVVYFPKDGTTYAFDEYFTENAFGSVIQLTEDLVNKYISLLRYNEIEPVEF